MSLARHMSLESQRLECYSSQGSADIALRYRARVMRITLHQTR